MSLDVWKTTILKDQIQGFGSDSRKLINDVVFENGQPHSLIAVFVNRAISFFYLKRLDGSQVAFKKCFDFWERESLSRESGKLSSRLFPRRKSSSFK